MKLCGKDCYPCCDFCAHARHNMAEIDGKMVSLGPIGCNLHNDKEHNELAEMCASCDDFLCFTLSETKEATK